MWYFFEEKIDVQLFEDLLAAAMVFLHGFPVGAATKNIKNVVNKISQKHDKIKFLSPKGAIIGFFVNIISHFQFIAVFTIKIDEHEQKYEGTKKPPDVGKSLIYFLEGTGYRYIFWWFSDK